MPYSPPTLSTIVRRLVTRLVSRTKLTDLHRGSETSQLLVSFAMECRAIYHAIGRLRDGRILDRAVAAGLEDDIEEIGAEILPDGLLRSAGARATCWGYFSRDGSVGDLDIGDGFVVGRRDGVSYRLNGATTIDDGDTDSPIVQVICSDLGTSGNAAVGALTRVLSTSPAGLRFTQTTEATGGLDREPVADYADRIRRYPRTLSRCNRPAVLDRVLSAQTTGGAKVLFAAILDDLAPGVRHIYVDDGTGTLANAWAVAAGETLTASAKGGEMVFYLRRRGVLADLPVFKNGIGLALDTEFTLRRSTGQLRLAEPLDPADELTTGQYAYWTGLVAEAIRMVHGDPTDLVNYPPYAGEGVELLVEGAKAASFTLTGTLQFHDGFDFETNMPKVVTRLVDYVNRRNIGVGVEPSALSAEAHKVRGLKRIDLDFEGFYPDADTAARITSEDVVLS